MNVELRVRIRAAFTRVRVKAPFTTSPELIYFEPNASEVEETARRMREVWTEAELQSMDDRSFGHSVRTVWELVRWTRFQDES